MWHGRLRLTFLNAFSLPYQMPAGGIWQSFRPGYSGNLTRIDVLLGMAKPVDDESSKLSGKSAD